MKKLLLALVLALSALTAPALAANCSSYPFTLTNGQTADANQVMANFNSILNCGNNSLAHNAANADITTLTALTSLTLPASTTGGATFTVLPGTAPTSPINGNLWTTSVGVFARINGVTQQLAASGSGVTSFNSRTGAVAPTSGDYTVAQVTGAAPLASPALTGTPTAPTATGGTNTTQLATTAFVQGLLASPALTGTPTAPTATAGTNTTQIATTAFVQGLLGTANTWALAQTFTTAPVFTNQSGSRTALGLGTSATVNTGTSGATIPLLNAANTWATTQTFTAAPVFTNQSGSRTALGLGGAAVLSVGTSAGTVAAGDDSRFGGPTQNIQNASYGLVLGDAGGQVAHFSASGHTYTIPANASVAFPVGTKIDIVNGCTGGTLLIAITSDTLNWIPSATTGTRTLVACAEATLTKITSTVWYITGVGLS